MRGTARNTGRRDLAHVLRDRLRVLDEVQHRAGVEAEVGAGDALGDMAERQEADALVRLALRQDGGVAARGVEDVAVREHRALRLAGRAGGVDEDRQVVGPPRREPRLPQLGMRLMVLGAEATQLLEADHHRIAEAMQPVHVEHDDLAEVRQPRAHLERLVELLLVLDEEVDRARVGHQVFDLGGGVGRIDAGAHAARAEHAEVGVEPFAPRVREHRGGLARLEAEAHEAEADLARGLAELAPGRAAPDPELLLPQRDLVAAARDRVPEHERGRCRRE